MNCAINGCSWSGSSGGGGGGGGPVYVPPPPCAPSGTFPNSGGYASCCSGLSVAVNGRCMVCNTPSAPATNGPKGWIKPGNKTIDWGASSNANGGYVLLVQPGFGPQNALDSCNAAWGRDHAGRECVYTGSGTSWTYEVPNSSRGESYDWIVWAGNACGEKTSSRASFNVCKLPGTPQLTRPDDGEVISPFPPADGDVPAGKYYMRWNSGDDATHSTDHWEIRINDLENNRTADEVCPGRAGAPDGKDYTGDECNTGVQSREYPFILTSGHSYRWRVDGINRSPCNERSMSNSQTFSVCSLPGSPQSATQPTSPGRTNSSNPTEVAAGPTTLNWRSVSSATSYTLLLNDKSIAGTGRDKCGTAGANDGLDDECITGITTNSQVVTLVGGREYAWQVESVNSCGTNPSDVRYLRAVAPPPECGNGVLDAGEQCDLGVAGNGPWPSVCSTLCTTNTNPISDDPWIQLRDASFQGSAATDNLIPATKTFITDEAGIVAGGINLGDDTRAGGRRVYTRSISVDTNTYPQSANARKRPRSFTAASEIDGTSPIYIAPGDAALDITISDLAAGAASRNFVIINKAGTVHINSNYTPTGSQLIIADRIIIADTVTQVNAILVANTIDLGGGTNPLIINGNLATSTLVPTSKRDLSDNQSPGVSIIVKPQMYLDLLPQLALVKVNWRKVQ